MGKREAFIVRVKMVAYTSNTMMDSSVLMDKLDSTAQRGYALDTQETIDGMVALAVPITG